MSTPSHDSRKVEVEGRMYTEPLDPEYQYRKIYLALLLYVREMMELLYERGGSELAQEGVQRGASVWASKLGEQIVRDFDLTKDLEGVGKLMEIYNGIFSSYNIRSEVEDDSVVTVLNDCTHWDLLMKDKGVRCDQSCTHHEIPSVVKAAGDYTVTMPESRPCGDSRCVFKITRAS
jgi:predicted ArsR family transcriptional regulator